MPAKVSVFIWNEMGRNPSLNKPVDIIKVDLKVKSSLLWQDILMHLLAQTLTSTLGSRNVSRKRLQCSDRNRSMLRASMARPR